MNAVAQPRAGSPAGAASGRVCRSNELPAGELAQLAQDGADDGTPGAVRLDGDDAALAARANRSTVDARRDHAVVAREALRAAASAASSEVASSASTRASSRSRRPRLAGPSSRSGERNVAAVSVSRVDEREVGQARQPRLEAVDDVEGALPRIASARFARTPTGTPTRLRRDTGTAGPSAITSPSSWPRASARRPASEVGRAPRRRQHGDLVAARAQRGGQRRRRAR